MSTPPFEQRNRYKGDPARPWVRLRFIQPDGTVHNIELLADTGSPSAIVISPALMAILKRQDADDHYSNFGWLQGGWLRLSMPELGLDQDLLAYASDDIAIATRASNPDFEGLAGLPFLRLLEYGGNADEFWIRPVQHQP